MSEDQAPSDSKTAVGSASPGQALVFVGLGLLAGLALGSLFTRASTEPPAPAASAPDDSPVLVRVGDETVTVEQFRLRWAQLSPEIRRLHHRRGGGPSGYLEQVVEELLLAREARRRGLDAGLEIQEAMRRERNQVLAQPLLAEEVSRKAIGERELQMAYDTLDNLDIPARVLIRELVATGRPGRPGVTEDATTESAARTKMENLARRLAEGEDFDELVRVQSESPTYQNGGSIGWVSPGRFRPEYETAAMGLEVGAYSPIFESRGDWVLLRAEDREEARVVSFEEKRQELLNGLLEEDPGALSRRYAVFVAGLREAEAQLEVFQELLPDDLKVDD